MAPLFVKAEGLGHDAPADCVDHMLNLAQCIEYYLTNHTENICFSEYADLLKLETKLSAYVDLLTTLDRKTLLSEAIAEAEEHFGYI